MTTQCDYVEKALGSTETGETNLGNITIPATGVSRIIGVAGIITIETSTAGEGVAGYVKLVPKTKSGVYKFPAQIIQGPAGTIGDSGETFTPKFIPVDIDVPANETITCYAALFKAQTGSCRGAVFLLME